MQTQRSTHTLRLQPLKGFLAIGGILFLLWCFILSAPAPHPPLWLMLGLLLPVLANFSWVLYAMVCADENSLRWRNFGRWQSARWEEIDDYFFMISQNDGRPVSWLRFHDGRTLQLSESYWSDQTAFRALVVERATQAKPSGWLLRGKEGTITGRHVFAYKKRPDYFEADEQSVHYFDGHTLHSAAWSDVLALHDPLLIFQRSVFTLDTREWSASFSSALKGQLLLRAMIRQYAPHVSPARLRTPPRELLIPTEREDGKRTFHYQTRLGRIGLALPLLTGSSFLAAGIWLLLLSRRYGLEDTHKVIVLLMGVGVMSMAIWVIELRCFKIEQIIVDRESVTWVRLRGERRVFFEEIKEIESSSGTDILVTHSGERPIRWRHSLANVAELRQEIEARIGR